MRFGVSGSAEWSVALANLLTCQASVNGGTSTSSPLEPLNARTSQALTSPLSLLLHQLFLWGYETRDLTL